jgi:hypothetical protein
MDRHALELNVREASARVVVGQQALLRQRQQIAELEQYRLDATAAKALLWLYEQSQAMNLFDRNRLRHELAGQAAASVDPLQESRSNGEHDAIDLRSIDRKAA